MNESKMLWLTSQHNRSRGDFTLSPWHSYLIMHYLTHPILRRYHVLTERHIRFLSCVTSSLLWWGCRLETCFFKWNSTTGSVSKFHLIMRVVLWSRVDTRSSHYVEVWPGLYRHTVTPSHRHIYMYTGLYRHIYMYTGLYRHIYMYTCICDGMAWTIPSHIHVHM